MQEKVTTSDRAIQAYIRDGQILMVGGFGRGGTPFTLIDCLADRWSSLSNLVIVKNDANEPDLGVGRLFRQRMVSRLISTHLGLNPDFIQRMNRSELECEILPQGIFAEKIRAGGAGIAAILTDVGIGTEVEEGKESYYLDGKKYLVERALRGNVALLCADIADRAGNCWWSGTNRNMSVPMGTACERVIVEAKTIVPTGDIQPENVHLPSVFVDAVVPAGKRRHQEEGSE